MNLKPDPDTFYYQPELFPRWGYFSVHSMDDLGLFKLRFYENGNHYLQENAPGALPMESLVAFKKGDVLVAQDWMDAVVIEDACIGKPKSLYCRFIHTPDKHMIGEATDWNFDNVRAMHHMTMEKYKSTRIKRELKR